MLTERGKERSSVHRGMSPASLGLQQLNEGLVRRSPEPGQTLGFIKEERFKVTLKCREDVSLPNPTLGAVFFKKRALALTPIILFLNSMNHI